MEGFPWDDLRNILHGGQRIAMVQNGIETFRDIKVSRPACSGDHFFGLGDVTVLVSVIGRSRGNGLGSHTCWSRGLKAIICFLIN